MTQAGGAIGSNRVTTIVGSVVTVGAAVLGGIYHLGQQNQQLIDSVLAARNEMRASVGELKARQDDFDKRLQSLLVKKKSDE